MKKKAQLTLPSILLIIFVIIVVIVILFLVFSGSSMGFSLKSKDSSQDSQTSFVEFESPTSDQKQQICEYVEVPYRTKYTDSYFRTYERSRDYYDCDYGYLDYDADVEVDISEGAFGNEIHRYYVYVENEGYKPGYFTVKFYMRDYDDWDLVDSQTQYIKPDEEKRFFYRTIYGEEIWDWDFEVISKTESYDCYRDYAESNYYRDYTTEKRCYWI